MNQKRKYLLVIAIVLLFIGWAFMAAWFIPTHRIGVLGADAQSDARLIAKYLKGTWQTAEQAGFTKMVVKNPPETVYYKLTITAQDNQLEHPLEYTLEPRVKRNGKWLSEKPTTGSVAGVGFGTYNRFIFNLKTDVRGPAVIDYIHTTERGELEASFAHDGLGSWINITFYRDTSTVSVVLIVILICLGLGYYLWKKQVFGILISRVKRYNEKC